jgi:hypothetical protein
MSAAVSASHHCDFAVSMDPAQLSSLAAKDTSRALGFCCLRISIVVRFYS